MRAPHGNPTDIAQLYQGVAAIPTQTLTSLPRRIGWAVRVNFRRVMVTGSKSLMVQREPKSSPSSEHDTAYVSTG